MPLHLGGDIQLRSVSEIRAFVKSLKFPVPQWVLDLVDVLERNEAACAPWYTHGKSVECSYVKYNEAAAEDLPKNWVVVGDAAMKLNHHYGTRMLTAVMCEPSTDFHSVV